MTDPGSYYPIPCPFCDCNKVMSWHVGHYDKPWVIECMGCSAQGPHADTEEKAFELWNRRYLNGMVTSQHTITPRPRE